MSRPLLAALVDDAALFPPGNAPMPEVAGFLRACTERGLTHKCTAGLHSAVRRPPYHGFLNVLLAAHAATTGGDVHSALSEEDGAALAAMAKAIPADEAVRTRRRYAGCGSCDLHEPVADLTALGLWPGDGG